MQKLEEQLERIPDDAATKPPMEQLSYYWPVIVMLLTFAKIFTGKKGDEKINLILAFGRVFLGK